MDAFQRGAGHQCPLPWNAEQIGRFNDQKRAESLAAAQPRIAHGLDQPFRACRFAADRRQSQKPVQQSLGIGRHGVQTLEESGFFLGIIAIHHVLPSDWPPCGVLFSILHLRDNGCAAQARAPAAGRDDLNVPPKDYLWPTTS